MSRGEEDDLLRKENAKQLLSRARCMKQKYNIPVFAFGDFNSLQSSEVFEFLESNNFVLTHKFAEKKTDIGSHHGDPVLGSDGCYHGEKTSKKLCESLDYILMFSEDAVVKNYVVIEDQCVLDSTDHSPVYTDVELKTGK